MELAETTDRTKRAIRKWAGEAPGAQVLLADTLDSHRLSAREQLRRRINKAFDGRKSMPITPTEWNSRIGQIRNVEGLRDWVHSRVNG